MKNIVTLVTVGSNVSSQHTACKVMQLCLFALTFRCLRWRSRWTICINLMRWKELQPWSCSCTMTTAVRTGICPPPHGTHFVPLILPLFPHVSKSVRDQMCFHSVLMFIFSRGVFWHLGYHMEDERWVALRGKFIFNSRHCYTLENWMLFCFGFLFF